MHTVRVDGNDIFAVHLATAAARALAVEKCVPVLVESMSYREGHHSTSDDSTRYRDPAEIKEWRERGNPILRLRRYMEARGWWSDAEEAAAQREERKGVLAALAAAEAKPKPDPRELFTDVYAGEQPWTLRVQAEHMEAMRKLYPDHYVHGGH
jgi:2-oxoisovalerate dehydrogenase E1 component alpha subunit